MPGCQGTATHPAGYYARKPAELLLAHYDGFNNPAPNISAIVWSSWVTTARQGAASAVQRVIGLLLHHT